MKGGREGRRGTEGETPLSITLTITYKLGRDEERRERVGEDGRRERLMRRSRRIQGEN